MLVVKDWNDTVLDSSWPGKTEPVKWRTHRTVENGQEKVAAFLEERIIVERCNNSHAHFNNPAIITPTSNLETKEQKKKKSTIYKSSRKRDIYHTNLEQLKYHESFILKIIQALFCYNF